MNRKWNSEKFIVFSIVILQQQLLVTRARDIKKRTEWRMDAWMAGTCKMLVQDRESTLELLLNKKQGIATPEQRATTFHQKVLKGDIHSERIEISHATGNGGRPPLRQSVQQVRACHSPTY
jgi:hypothetical protein